MEIRLSKRMKMLHVPTLRGDGKWENKMCYIKYKLARKKANKVSRISRRINRG